MTPTSQISAVMFGFLKKSITYHNSALVVPAVTAAPIVPELIEKILTTTSHKDLAMPVFCSGIGLFCYLLVFTSDFITGIRAAKHESGGAPGYIKSDKLWSSFWKLYGVLLVLFFLTIFCLLFAILNSDWLYTGFLYAIVALLVMVSLFDLHSIGENHKRRYGKKPALFDFLDRVTKAIDEKIMTKIKSF